MRRPALAVLAPLAVVLVACGGSSTDVAREWLPKLQEENSFICQQDVCDTSERRAELTADLAADAREGGDDYRAVAALAERASLAYEHWDEECYPSGTTSQSAGMSCDEAFDLTLYGTDQLQELLVGVAEGQ